MSTPPVKKTTAQLNAEHLDRIEKKNIKQFVDNYLKMDLDPVAAYKNTFDKQLWKSTTNAKKRALALLEDMKFQEMKNSRLDNLREVYKEEINLAFGHLTKILKEDTFISHKHHYDPDTKKAKQYRVKENISHSSKNKAAELILKTMGYLDKQEQNVNIIHNEYEIVRNIIDEVESEIIDVKPEGEDDE